MHTRIVFDENSSSWEKMNFEFNKLYARSQLIFIRDIYKVRGYMYLNTIYEDFGLIWNPYDENTCWIYERDGELELSIQYDEQSCSQIIIEVLCNSK